MVLTDSVLATLNEIRIGKLAFGFMIVSLVISAGFVLQKRNDRSRFGLDETGPHAELEYSAYVNERRRLAQTGYQDVLIKICLLIGGVCLLVSVVSFSIDLFTT